jgi:hypothetical protein
MTDGMRKDINGLGERVTRTEREMSSISTKVERNENDIQKIFSSIAKLPYWIVGSMMVPSVLTLYLILSNKVS